jgi:hypothetical protein
MLARRPVTTFAVSPDGQLLAYGTADLSIGVNDALTLQVRSLASGVVTYFRLLSLAEAFKNTQCSRFSVDGIVFQHNKRAPAFCQCRHEYTRDPHYRIEAERCVCLCLPFQGIPLIDFQASWLRTLILACLVLFAVWLGHRAGR